MQGGGGVGGGEESKGQLMSNAQDTNTMYCNTKQNKTHIVMLSISHDFPTGQPTTDWTTDGRTDMPIALPPHLNPPLSPLNISSSQTSSECSQHLSDAHRSQSCFCRKLCN